MAATEVIRFPLWLQLDRGLSFPAYASFESADSSPGSPPPLVDLLQGTASSAPHCGSGGLRR